MSGERETVLVTGGLGSSGRWVVDRLLDDYDVVCVDLDHPGFEATPREGLDFRAADLTDRGETFDLIEEVDPDAVVHWAAIPVAGEHPDGTTFETNTLAAYNVLTAAGRADARVVQASSDGAYGFFFADPTPLPDALPIPESHDLLAEDPYGLSKIAAERCADRTARRDGVSVTSIRPSWIQFPGEYPCREPEYVEDLGAGAGNFWSYVDVRDVADLVAAALTDPVDGHEAVNCVAADNALGRPLVDLLRRHYGAIPDDCAVAADSDRSAYAIEKAERLFGWTPSRSWRDAADERVHAPDLLEG
ncbi:NAD(P)-dependent oxidoreductase [Haloparvum alkalitolerans]|uniref:NAD-dependent epimerase/dehydratase family protein n=1 Tax=Haloparvum alkalitolerans TaxID=1042953 RepID=UPI003CF42B37